MTPEQFCYWLQGFSEITNSKAPLPCEWDVIQDHLRLVFEKKTPKYPQDRLDYMTTYSGLVGQPILTC